MTKEEFVDNTSVLNKTISNMEAMLDKLNTTKKESVELFIKMNKKFDFGQRVRIKHKENDVIYYGYIVSIFVDEDYGVLFYKSLLEDKETKKENTDGYSITAVDIEDIEYSKYYIEKAS